MSALYTVLGLLLLAASYLGLRALRTRLVARTINELWLRLAVQCALAGVGFGGLQLLLTQDLPRGMVGLLFGPLIFVAFAILAGCYRLFKPVDAEFNTAWQRAHMAAGRSLRAPGAATRSGSVSQAFRQRWLVERQYGLSASKFLDDHWGEIEAVEDQLG